MGEWIWGGLNTAQADGQACVACGREWLRDRRGPTRRVPVGRARSTGSQVFACVGACAARASARCYRGGSVVICPEALSEASAALRRAVIASGLTVVGDLDLVGEAVTAVVAAAAPLVIAAELRCLAGVFEDRARAVWSQITDTMAALEGTDPAGQRYDALWECAHLARERAFAMDPAGGSS